jgi:NADPH-dependent ferric siderophore reductase
MASIKSFLRDTVGQLVFKELALDAVRDVSPHFRRLRVSGESLRGTACAPGDKLQIMIADAGPRTYTPFAHDAASGSLELLAYVHGDSPAALWSRNVQSGARPRAFGPRASLALAALTGPVVLFGDETSFAVAKSLHDARGGGAGLSCVFECTQQAEAALVLRDLGLASHALVQRQHDRAHLDALDTQLRAALARLGTGQGANLVLTGHAQTIQALRARLKARPAAQATQKVKAYWADGKQGLD